MLVKELMSKPVAFCTPETPLEEVATLMRQEDCGSIPVVDNQNGGKLLGIVTDRDIVCRSLAIGKNPLELRVADCMSNSAITASPDMSVDECCDLMTTHQVRRLPVIDRSDSNQCCGMISLEDIARTAPVPETAKVVQAVSQPM